MITVQGETLTVDTQLLTATLARGFLTSLVSKLDGRPYLTLPAPEGAALQLRYAEGDPIDVVGKLACTITPHRLSDHAAEFRFSGWDADGVLRISEDAAD